MRAIGYCRVSTNEQEAGLSAQRQTIEAEIYRRKWTPIHMTEERIGGSTPWNDRDGLTWALGELTAHRADVLICAKLDRLSRSLLDFATILDKARREKWAIVLLDFGLDMSTPVGSMVAGILAAVAEFEKARIGERTRDALKAKKAAGVKLGRPSRIDPEVEARIVRERVKGNTYEYISGILSAYGIPTVNGGPWRANSVRAIYRAATRV